MKAKKITSMLLTVLVVVSVILNIDIFAGAVDNITKVSASHIKTVFNVNNYKYGNYPAETNIGGISVGAANNRLFVVKSNSDQQISVLYYYRNIYDSDYSTGSKSPKTLIFTDGLLGHANSMAVDDNYIYVTMWQSGTDDELEKNSVIQISRTAISSVANGTVINSRQTIYPTTTGGTIEVYRKYEPVYSDGTPYNRAITAITRYKYDKTNGITKFIIPYAYSADLKTIMYTIATLEHGGQFKVSTSKDDVFKVDNSEIFTKAKNVNTIHFQDIFYDSAYGLLIPIWAEGTRNFVLRVDISGLKTQGKTQYLNLSPTNILEVTKSSDANGNLKKFEIESIAFVKRDANLQDIGYRLIFSCNKADMNEKGCDSIEEITPLARYLNTL